MPRERVNRSLLELAKLYGIQLWHIDGFGKQHRPGAETLLAALRELGAGIEHPSEADDALTRRHSVLAGRAVEPVQVSWSDQSPEFRFKLSSSVAPSTKLKLTLSGESGYRKELAGNAGSFAVTGSSEADGHRTSELAWPLPEDIPDDVHRSTLEFGGEFHSSTLLRAPLKAAGLPDTAPDHRLGLFLPTYAIRSESSWGMGDYSDLANLRNIASTVGASAVATLPLFPVFEDDPSPFSPVSRLFWNELYVDPREVAEFGSCEAAQRTVQSEEFAREIKKLEGAEFVDYGKQYALRRPLLKALTDFALDSPQLSQELEHFAEHQPRAESYAKFRAACEKLGRPWTSWNVDAKRELRQGEHFEQTAYDYHLNAQRLAFEQVGKLVGSGDTTSPQLFLDMPLGVRGDGFDPWLKPDLFTSGISAGAPPDSFFTSGQNWGFPPMKPDSLREDGYQYLKESLRHIAASAGILRIDHVMSLHRLYWIPDEMEASDGAYVKYPSEEMYALLTLESQRTGTALVGEDLGTVPRYVGPAMRRHNMYRMYATYFNIRPASQPGLIEPGPDMFAYINTHDMPSFAAFVEGADISDRLTRGLLTARQARSESRDRKRLVSALRKQLEADDSLEKTTGGTDDLLSGLLHWLQRKDAAMLVVNLEDLWLEMRPQNTPGTFTERPNWKGRSQLTLRQIEYLLKTRLASTDLRTG